MTRLKLADLAEDKPVRLTITVPERLHRDLLAYAAQVNGGEARGAPPVERLIVPMLERFMAADRTFVRQRRVSQSSPSVG